MIRIILKESKYGLTDRDYGFRHIRFLKMIKGLNDLVLAATLEFSALKGFGQENKEAFEKLRNSLWLDIIKQVEPLKTENITKVMGFGSLGGAYLLTNGNVLKIGVDVNGYNLNFKNDHIPDELVKDHFSGQGTSSELHVHGTGRIKMPWHGKISGYYFDDPWSWREVPRYTTFHDWLKEKGLEYHAYDVSGIAYEINAIFRKTGRQTSFGPFVKWFMENRKNNYGLLKDIDDEDAIKLLKAIYDISSRRVNVGVGLDLKADNLGVDQHGNFVFFDF